MMLEAGEGWKGTDGAWVAFPDPSDGREEREGGSGREDREQSWEAKLPHLFCWIKQDGRT